jgi:hypothetical protein
MRNHRRSLTGGLIGFGLAIGLGAVGVAAASDPQVPTAQSPRVEGVTPIEAVKGHRNAAAPPATAQSHAGAAQQLTKGQPTNLAPPVTAKSPPGAWILPQTKSAR